MISFTSLLVTPLDSNTASKMNYWDNSIVITELPKQLIAKQLIKPSNFSLKEAEATGGVL